MMTIERLFFETDKEKVRGNILPKISIVGRGVDPAKHLSLSALSTLKDADKIVGIESEKEFWKQLQKEFGVGEIEDLGNLYRSQDNDMVNYCRFVDYVLHLSSEITHLALLVAGHPRLGVTFIELLKKNAPKDTEIEIIEGISSFDVMINNLGLDPLEQGTVLLDANRLLLFHYRIEPALSYFIYHVCSIGNPQTNFVEPSLNNRIDLLKNYLLKFYLENKEVFLCRASNGKNEVSKIFRTTIVKLDSIVKEIDYSTTLYLPSEKPSQLDWDYLNILK
jgi:uncharacterized protein YabN with tetrapyrrole methylase and pyrophosphatase domain